MVSKKEKPKKKSYLETLMEVDPLGETMKKASNLARKANKGSVISIKDGNKSAKADKSALKKVAKRPSDRVTERKGDRETERHSDRPTTRPSNKETERPSNRATERKGDRETERPYDRASDRVTERPRDREGDFYTYINEEEFKDFAVVELARKPDDLTLRQYCVLHHIYFNRPFKVECIDGLGKIMGMGPNNAKNQVNSLTMKGYIKKPYSINDGVNKGSTCRVVEKLCLPLFGPTNIPNPDEKSNQLKNLLFNRETERPSDRDRDRVTGRPSNRDRDRVTGRPGALNSSSSLYNKSTTTEDDILSDENILILLNHPELTYWESIKIQPRQIRGWLKELNLSLDDLLESLKHCRFDIVENDLKIKKTPYDYFYGRLRKAGFYHAPKNYKSHEDKVIEREEARVKRAREEMEKLRQARRDREQAELDLEFEKIMSNPEGEVYKKCFDRLNDFSKKLKKGKAFEGSMKSAFMKIMEEG